MDVAFIQQASTLAITSSEERAHMQVSASDRWKRTIPFITASISAKGLLQCWKLRKLELGRHLRPCAGKSLGCQCCSVRASRNHVASSGSQQEWAEHQTTFALRRSSMSHPELAIHIVHQDWKRAHMRVSASDHCERTILFPVSILAKGQINEECPLRNVDIWESRHCRPCVNKILLVADAVFWRLPGIQSLPGITLPVPVPGKKEPRIKQLLPCWKSKHLP